MKMKYLLSRKLTNNGWSLRLRHGDIWLWFWVDDHGIIIKRILINRRGEKAMGKKKIAWMLILSMLFSVFPYQVGWIQEVKAGDYLFFRYEHNKEANEHGLFGNISNPNPNQVVVAWNVNEHGKYEMTTYLKDKQKISIVLDKPDDKQITVNYIVQNHTVGGWVYAKYSTDSYQLFDHEQERYTDVKYKVVGGNSFVERIFTSTSSYTSDNINVDNRTIKFEWQRDKKTFFVSISTTHSESKGKIIPVILQHGGSLGPKNQLNVFKNLDFEVKPTHLEKDGGVIKDYTLIDMRNNPNLIPGSKPGLRLIFKRPVELDTSTYEFSKNLSNDIDLTFKIYEQGRPQDDPKTLQFKLPGGVEPISIDIKNEANSSIGATRVVNSKNHEIDLIKDEMALVGSVVDSNEFINWNKLDSSSIYTVNIALQTNHYEIDASYKPFTKTEKSGIDSPDEILTDAFTYLQYEVRRRTIDTTYLVIKPYKVSGYIDVKKTEQVLIEGTLESFKAWENWVSHYDQEGKGDEVYLPIDSPKAATYKVLFRPGLQAPQIGAQAVIYDKTIDKNINPPVPEIQSIDQVRVLAKKDEHGKNIPGEFEKVQFTLRWRIPDELPQMLKATDQEIMYYEVFLNTKPLEKVVDETQKYQLFKAFTVKKVGEGRWSLQDASEAGNSKIFLTTDGVFEWDIVLNKDNQWIKPLKASIASDKIDYAAEDSALNDFFNTGTILTRIPGTYFVQMKAAYQHKDSGNTEFVVPQKDFSIPASVTLEILEEKIPIPTSVVIEENIANKWMDFRWQPVSTDRYESFMLKPIEKNIDSKEYEIFIAEHKKTGNPNLYPIDRLKQDIAQGNDENSVGSKVYELVGNQVYELNTENLEILRGNEKNILKITTSDPGFIIKNLDPNTVYDFIMRTKINVKNKDASLENTPRYSEFSDHKTFTPSTAPKDPDDSERVIPTPEKLAKQEIKSTSIQLAWEKPTFTVKAGEALGFEMLRIPGKRLEEQDYGKQKSIGDILALQAEKYPNIKGWRAKEKELFILPANTLAGTDYLYKIEHIVDNLNKAEFTNRDITPNTIYYYYVRTVVIKGNEAAARSAWQAIAVTTSPVEAPTNLAEERTGYSKNGKKETIISFDSSILKEDVPNKYQFYIAVKGEKDQDYWPAREERGEVIDTTKYRADIVTPNVQDQNKPNKYIYRISHLEAGKKYSIKIAVWDKTKGKLQGEYPQSGFSNKIDIRTEFDQDEYDRDILYDEYKDYFKKKAELLKNTPYWTAEDSTRQFIAKYRGEQGSGDLKALGGSSYPLSQSSSNRFIYYIPAEMFNVANNSNIALGIKKDNMEITLRPHTIDPEGTEEIRSILREIQKRNGSIKDYFVVVTADFSQLWGRVNGEEVASRQIRLEMAVRGSKKTEKDLDQDLLKQFDQVVNAVMRSELENKLTTQLKLSKVIDNQKLNEIVEDALVIVKKQYAQKVSEILVSQILDARIMVSVQVPIQLTIGQMETGEYQAYHKQTNVWEVSESTPVVVSNGGIGIEIRKLGTYVFTKRLIQLPGIDKVPNSAKIKDIFMKYGLTEFFGSGSDFKIENPVTRAMWIGTTAKILGAPKADDYFKYLRSRGFTDISSARMFSSITTEEAIYMSMKLYEAKTNTNLRTLQIRNFNAVQDSSKVKQEYRQGVLAAVDLRLIETDEDRNINPTATMKIGKALEMLVKMLMKAGE